MATTAKPISLDPRMAACLRGMPSSMCRKIFSSTTIASSTTRPMASTIASKVSVLMENPNKYSKEQAPIKDTGIVTMGIKLARTLRKKKKITSTTSTIASRMVW